MSMPCLCHSTLHSADICPQMTAGVNMPPAIFEFLCTCRVEADTLVWRVAAQDSGGNPRKFKLAYSRTASLKLSCKFPGIHQACVKIILWLWHRRANRNDVADGMWLKFLLISYFDEVGKGVHERLNHTLTYKLAICKSMQPHCINIVKAHK